MNAAEPQDVVRKVRDAVKLNFKSIHFLSNYLILF